MSKAQYEAVFDSMDADGSGTVTLEEMKVKLQGHGFRESQIEVILNPFSFSFNSSDKYNTVRVIYVLYFRLTSEQLTRKVMRMARLQRKNT